MEERIPQTGDSVIYHDPKGAPHPALVTAVWSPICVNVVFVSPSADETDQYGRQIKRETSVTSGKSHGQAHGRYWRWEHEEPNAYTPPVG